MQIDTQLDLSDLDRSLDSAEQAGKRLRPAFRELAKPLRVDQREHAKQQQGPDSGWAPRAKSTEERRRAGNRATRVTKAMRTILPKKFRSRSTPKRILGKLPSAVVYTTGDLFVRARSRAPWAGAHQHGGRVGRRSTLPARPFLWLSSRVLEVARQIFADHLAKAFQR